MTSLFNCRRAQLFSSATAPSSSSSLPAALPLSRRRSQLTPPLQSSLCRRPSLGFPDPELLAVSSHRRINSSQKLELVIDFQSPTAFSAPSIHHETGIDPIFTEPSHRSICSASFPLNAPLTPPLNPIEPRPIDDSGRIIASPRCRCCFLSALLSFPGLSLCRAQISAAQTTTTFSLNRPSQFGVRHRSPARRRRRHRCCSIPDVT